MLHAIRLPSTEIRKDRIPVTYIAMCYALVSLTQSFRAICVSYHFIFMLVM